MARRGIRMMLWGTLVLAVVVTAYFFWVDESQVRSQAAAEVVYRESAGAASRALLDLRAAQQAYVASGQGHDFWFARAAASMANTKAALAALRSAASPAAQGAVRTGTSMLDDFEQMDRRVREYVSGGQILMASDIIFSDGLEITEGVWTEVQRAQRAEQAERDRVIRDLRRHQWTTLAVGALSLCTLALLLVPVPRSRQEMRAGPVTLDLQGSQPNEDLGLGGPATTVDDDFRPPPQPSEAMTPHSVAQADVDLSAVGTLCSDLARGRSLSTILERTAAVLDATGIVLWIADPDSRELSPILSHGYSPQMITRLGTIPREADNVTAAAFRTSLLQTVKADDTSRGAIAAPLVTTAGCTGVMAVEVRHRGEQQHARLAAATVIAAQLATLVGPPVARTGNAEVAGG